MMCTLWAYSDISVTAGGDNYDVVNPPILSVTDSVGIGVSAYCEVKGAVERIDVLDEGFDYIETYFKRWGNGLDVLLIQI